MDWQEVCNHKDLRNLPFKIELNEYGQVIISPVKLYHSCLQGEIALLLHQLLKTGKILPECAIKTSKGTRVADVAWASPELWQKIKTETDASIAPEICVEVVSDSNTQAEMSEKRALYFESGAKEVWLCNEKGEMRFFNFEHELIHSDLVSNFPLKIEV